MRTKEEIVAELIAKVTEKAGTSEMICSICHHNQWLLDAKYVVLPISPHPGRIALGGPSYPTVALICSTCGNTHFLNLRVLGYSDMDALAIHEDVKKTA